MKMILTKHRDAENRFDNADVTITADVITLDEALEAFESFLRGCGFVFSGQITILDEEEVFIERSEYENVPNEYGSRDGQGLSAEELHCGESIVKPIDRNPL